MTRLKGLPQLNKEQADIIADLQRQLRQAQEERSEWRGRCADVEREREQALSDLKSCKGWFKAVAWSTCSRCTVDQPILPGHDYSFPLMCPMCANYALRETRAERDAAIERGKLLWREHLAADAFWRVLTAVRARDVAEQRALLGAVRTEANILLAGQSILDVLNTPAEAQEESD